MLTEKTSWAEEKWEPSIDGATKRDGAPNWKVGNPAFRPCRLTRHQRPKVVKNLEDYNWFAVGILRHLGRNAHRENLLGGGKVGAVDRRRNKERRRTKLESWEPRVQAMPPNSTPETQSGQESG